MWNSRFRGNLKTVDILVARRFKLRGMSWYDRNAANLLRLRLLKINGEWIVTGITDLMKIYHEILDANIKILNMG